MSSTGKWSNFVDLTNVSDDDESDEQDEQDTPAMSARVAPAHGGSLPVALRSSPSKPSFLLITRVPLPASKPPKVPEAAVPSVDWRGSPLTPKIPAAASYSRGGMLSQAKSVAGSGNYVSAKAGAARLAEPDDHQRAAKRMRVSPSTTTTTTSTSMNTSPSRPQNPILHRTPSIRDDYGGASSSRMPKTYIWKGNYAPSDLPVPRARKKPLQNLAGNDAARAHRITNERRSFVYQQAFLDQDKDSVISDASWGNTAIEQTHPQSEPVSSHHEHAPPPPARWTPQQPPPQQIPEQKSSRKKLPNHFTEEEDHYLIFLKEVKKLRWKCITEEYNKKFPYRSYPTIQTHYSSVLNTRDRSLDPPVLKLPRDCSNEAAVDWSALQAKAPAPRMRAPRESPVTHVRQPIEDAESSRIRPRRAAPVDYTWPKPRGNNIGDESNQLRGDFDEEMDGDSVMGVDVLSHESPPEAIRVASSTSDPIKLDNMYVMDAKVALQMRKHARGDVVEQLPYLTASERQKVQRPPSGWEWDPNESHRWQEGLIHVDFGFEEVAAVRQVVAQIRLPQNSPTSKLRDTMQLVTDSQILRLVDRLRHKLPSRSKQSIKAFLLDAQMGTISKYSRVYRMTAASSDHSFGSSHETSMASVLRRRELGQYARRGWLTASRPVTYKEKNMCMDTLGPSLSWTGASSDVHAVAWSPNGETFAAAAIAVDDPDSMQYNSPNNLLYADLHHKTIHELGEHFTQRYRTQTGANSTHAMFVSQDPKVFNTVTSVAFSKSGRVLYSAGYDEHIGIWNIDGEGKQPTRGNVLNVRAQVDMLTTSPVKDGMVAAAAKITENKAVRLLTFDEDDSSLISKTNFYSSKAVSRADLKILPTALEFEPRHGSLLLAGFGANAQDSGLDTTGELCLWDIQEEKPLSIHGSNRNVFDVEFNPFRRNMPSFAAGCVAGGGVNRGMRSLLRLYDLHGPKYTCPIEIECKALDMNDVVWCPHDEHMIAVGCTDGRTYVWDLRQPTDPLRTLTHGRSLMPLQDGVSHEITDTGVRFLSWGENTSRLYSGSSDGVVKVWDITRSVEDCFIKDLVTCDSGIMSGSFNEDTSKLVLGEVNGSIKVLEIGMADVPLRDAEILRFVPYQSPDDLEDDFTGGPAVDAATQSQSAPDFACQSLRDGELRTVPMGSMPVRQVVQGPKYAGPYDSSVDAPFLREQALEFQLSLANLSGPQCDIAACKNNFSKVTSEEIGDSGRSAGRIPDALRSAWTATNQPDRIVVGKSKCVQCGRWAQPPSTETVDPSTVLCERCSFACLRCGASNTVPATTEMLRCSACSGVWDIGTLGYESIHQPIVGNLDLNVPGLKRYGKEAYLEKLFDVDATFGDEMNALTDDYFSLAIDRPESPPL